VTLYWHHWAFEPALCKSLTKLVVEFARA
jgi:hypothetical protein